MALRLLGGRYRAALVAAGLAWCWGSASFAAEAPAIPEAGDRGHRLTAFTGAAVGEVSLRAPRGVETRDLRSLVSVAGPAGTYDPQAVRRSVKLLYRLGIFESVSVEATLDGARVDVVFHLSPAPVISGISILGEPRAPGAGGGALASSLPKGRGDRYARGDEAMMARDLEIALDRVGYHEAKVRPEVVPSPRGDRVRLLFHVDPGPPWAVSEVRLNVLPESARGDPRVAKVLERRGGMRSLVGKRYSKTRVEAEARELLASLRDAGFREAAVINLATTPAPGGAGMAISADVLPREHVELSFVGTDFRPDPLRLKRVIGYEAETSLTAGFVEDAERRLVDHLRRRGYVDATVRGERESAADGKGVRLVFTLKRGRPAVLLGRDIHFDGNRFLSRRELREVVRGASPDVLGRRRYTAGEAVGAAQVATEHYQARGFLSARVRPCPPNPAGEGEPSGTGEGSDPSPEVHPGVVQRLGRDRGAPSRDRLALRFCVEEGPRAKVVAVDLEPPPEDTLSDVGEEAIRDVLRPLQRQSYAPQRILEAVAALRRLYHSRGYPDADASVLPALDEGGSTVRLKVAVRPGEPALIGQVVVQGNRHTRLGLIRSVLDLAPGDPLDPARLQEGQRRLLATGLFSLARVGTLDARERVRDLVVEVRERPVYRLEIGGGASTEEGLRIVGEQRVSNIGGIGQRWTLLGQWGVSWEDLALLVQDTDTGLPRPEWKLATAYEFPWVPGVPLRISLKGLLNERDKQATFALRRWGLGAGLTAQFTPKLSLLGQFDLIWRYPDYSDPAAVLAPDPPGEERISPDAVDPDFEPGVLGIIGAEGPPRSQVRLGVFTLQAIADLRDDRFNPTRGLLASLQLDATDPSTLSQEHWFGVQAKLAAWLPLYDPARGVPFNVQLAAQFGWVTPYGGSEQVLLERRFRLGGSSTIRGFASGTVGPTVTRDRLLVPLGVDDGRVKVAVGGNLFYSLGVELHFPLERSRKLEAVFFGDAGTAWWTTPDPVLAEGMVFDAASAVPQWSLGIGLRYRTPIGPLAIDLGASPARFVDWLAGDLPEGETFGSLHFSVGTF
ncbi:BamA/TamA family outer membrane protein [Myxococcota bacterium]|nr:BamA/TamA family outer membrane protein [Myxococcota bacterium]